MARHVLLAAVIFCVTAMSAAAQTRQQFCQRWHVVCQRCEGLGQTVPRERCLAVCAQRMSQCLANGCYFFNSPRPRCEDRDRGVIPATR